MLTSRMLAKFAANTLGGELAFKMKTDISRNGE